MTKVLIADNFSDMGRPPLSRRSTTKLTGVRLTEDLRDQIIDLVGKNRMASFIREAIAHEIKRRDEDTTTLPGFGERVEMMSETSELPIALIRSAIDNVIQRDDLGSSISLRLLIEMDNTLAQVQQSLIEASQNLNELRAAINHEIEQRKMNR